ncbi:glycosyltransferase [Salinimicrobium terrae]|uniref:glycosyltransferase n=1 Tax=Salinimicrobium terrae TaxID=470866 RepID=UPI000425C80F|nr:glycosyltransferase [Salinimicrobium terrae]
MNILFFQDDAEVLGGTKTLIARMAKKLLTDGASVTVLFKTNKASAAVLNCFPEGCSFFFFDNSARHLWKFPFGLKKHLPEFEKPYDAIFTLSLDAYYFSEILKLYYNLKGKNFFYVVNPLALQSDSGYKVKLLLLRKKPPESLIFMNEECRTSFSKVFQSDLNETQIIPLPVEPRRRIMEKIPRKRIVSIGRIDKHMKTYNFTMIKEIKKLREKFPSLTWDIYGNGSSDCDLKQRIIDYKCEDFISLKGPISYDEMETVLLDAYAFIGMGTAAVEAASSGIPTIVSIAYASAPVSYGLLHELPFGNVGEENGSLKERNMGDILHDLLILNYQAYNRIQNKSASFAKRYSVDGAYASFKTLVCGKQESSVQNKPQLIYHWIEYLQARIALRLRKQFNLFG